MYQMRSLSGLITHKSVNRFWVAIWTQIHFSNLVYSNNVELKGLQYWKNYLNREFRLLSFYLKELLLSLTWKIFREIDLQQELLYYGNVDFTEFFSKVPHHTALCGKMKTLLSLKKISSNQLSSDFVSKTITFTKFLPKKSESKFP